MTYFGRPTVSGSAASWDGDSFVFDTKLERDPVYWASNVALTIATTASIVEMGMISASNGAIITGSVVQGSTGNIASGPFSHAEGISDENVGVYITATGIGSHAEGFGTLAQGDYSHSEGASDEVRQITAAGMGSHAEGNGTLAKGTFSHAEGVYTDAVGYGSHAEGIETIASGNYQHAQGKYNLRNNNFSLFIIGNGDHITRSDVVRVNPGIQGSGSLEVTGTISATVGLSGSLTRLTNGSSYLVAGTNVTITSASNGQVTINSTATGGGSSDQFWQSTTAGLIFATGTLGAHITGSIRARFLSSSNGATITGSLIQGEPGCVALGNYSHVEGGGTRTTLTGFFSHAEGYQTTCDNYYSHAEGLNTLASGYGSHAEGMFTTASNQSSHAEGEYSEATGAYSHAEGFSGYTLGMYSHAEGSGSIAHAQASHAEGYGTKAFIGADAAHTEGAQTEGRAKYSHAEGSGSVTFGLASHAEGLSTITSGAYSHAEGWGTIASGSYQHVQGKFNLRNNNFSLFVIGDGTGDANANRSDIVRVNSGSTGGTGRLEVTGSLGVTVGMTGSLSYTPGNGAYWADPDPTNVKDALDRIASLLYTLNSNTPIP